MKPVLDLSREVPLTWSAGPTMDDDFEVIGGLWFGPPGKSKYYSLQESVEPAGLIFACPGCGELNSIAFRPFDGHPVWSWDGNRDKPTTRPSILSDPAKGGCGWHGFLVAGRFQLRPPP